MNWDAVGAIAEILGAAAVIITLIYLAVQIRHVREQNEATALDHVIDSLNAFAGRVAESESLASVITRGRVSFNALSEEDRLRFETIHFVFLNNMESWFVQNEQIYGISKDQNVENIKMNITAFCNHPGFRELWTENRELYPHLKKLVDEALEESG
ncbi:MAG TPA: hypothetical protein VJ984_15345 [Xanthomonadales bacterium]|nr:hypothetical protein [Xanthomonadales bacterium]